MTTRNNREAMAQTAVSLCNEAMGEWVKSTINLEGGPMTCAIAAYLMPQAIEHILRQHMDPKDAELMLAKAKIVAGFCVLGCEVLYGDKGKPS